MADRYVVVPCPGCARPVGHPPPTASSTIRVDEGRYPCYLCRDLGFVRVAKKHLNVIRPHGEHSWALEDSLIGQLGDLAPEEAEELERNL